MSDDYLKYHREAWDREYALQGRNRPGFGIEPLYKPPAPPDEPITPRRSGSRGIVVDPAGRFVLMLLGLAAATAMLLGGLYVIVWIIHAMWRAT
jgi:hypothetical protein